MGTTSDHDAPDGAPAAQDGGLGPDRLVERGPRRSRMDPEVRRRVIRSLFPDVAGWVRYAVLLTLSVTIAAAGLLADSPAVVIGAMIVAPLMVPMQAMAVAIAMGWGRRLAVQALAVGCSIVGSVVVAGTLSGAVPGAALTGEVLARTSPGVLDLIVALAAGVAGAVALTREDVSSALPGVAVAVALVPPLSAVGITAQQGRTDLAGGALLLFGTNLAAIVVSGVVVLFLSGFVPFWVLRRSRPSALAAFGLALVLTVAVSVPLTRASISAAESAQDRQRVSAAVRDWLGPDARLDLTDLAIGDRRVTVALAGEVRPPPAAPLAERVRGILPGTELDIRWSQLGRVDPDDDGSGDERAELEAAEVRDAIGRWLLGAEGRFDVLATTVEGDGVLVELTGPQPPPAAGLLAEDLSRTLGRPVEAEVRWFQGVVLSSEDPDPAPRPADALFDAATAWADGAGLTVLDLRLHEDRTEVTVDLAGAEPPASLGGLVRALSAAWADLDDASGGELGEAPELRVRFTVRSVLLPTTTTTTTTQAPGVDQPGTGPGG